MYRRSCINKLIIHIRKKKTDKILFTNSWSAISFCINIYKYLYWDEGGKLAFLFIYLGLAAIPCIIASNKGLSFVKYLLISVFLTPVTGTVLAIKAKPSKVYRAFREKHRACPYCGEMLFEMASRCKYCGKDLTLKWIVCPECNKKYRVKVTNKTKIYKCKQCQSLIKVPRGLNG